MGVMALVVVVLLQIASSTALLSLAHGWLLVGVAVVASRVAATLGCLRGLPTASGSSLGAVVAGTVPGVVGGLAVVVTGAALTGATVVAGLQWWQGVAAMAALLVAVAWLLRSAVRVFGGINGDVLGASIEVGAGYPARGAHDRSHSMRTLITGGIRSGKSAIAENLMGEGTTTYVATSPSRPEDAIGLRGSRSTVAVDPPPGRRSRRRICRPP